MYFTALSNRPQERIKLSHSLDLRWIDSRCDIGRGSQWRDDKKIFSRTVKIQNGAVICFRWIRRRHSLFYLLTPFQRSAQVFISNELLRLNHRRKTLVIKITTNNNLFRWNSHFSFIHLFIHSGNGIELNTEWPIHQNYYFFLYLTKPPLPKARKMPRLFWVFKFLIRNWWGILLWGVEVTNFMNNHSVNGMSLTPFFNLMNGYMI